MNEHRKDEWEELGNRWRRDRPPMPTVADIRNGLRRKRRRLVLAWLADLALGVGLVALMVREIVVHPGPRTWVLVTALGVFLLIAVAFTVANRRGLWIREDASLDAYVRHGLEHCRRRLRTVRFAWLLYVAEVLFIAGYGIVVGLSADAWEMTAMVLGGFTLAFAAWTVWFRRRVLRERYCLAAIADDKRHQC